MKNGLFRKLICSIVLVTFTFSIVGSDMLLEHAYAATVAKSNISAPSADKTAIENIEIPFGFGEIKEILKGKNNKTVVHIQDAHCNYSAQHSIASLIEYLSGAYNIELVMLEGGVGNYDHSVFTKISDLKIREKVSDFFVKEGRLNGAEYFAINNPGKVKLFGMEDEDLYLKNLNSYRNFLQNKGQADKYVKGLSHLITNFKNKIYSRPLKELDEKLKSYNDKKTEFKDFLRFLVDKADLNSIDRSSFTNVNALTALLKAEESIDFKKANSERNILIDKLSIALPKAELKELVTKSVRFANHDITSEQYYGYLFKKAKLSDVDFSTLPNLVRYSGYVKKYDGLDTLKLFEEMESLGEKLFENLAKTDDQKMMRLLDRNFSVLKDMFNVSLVREKYDYYKSNQENFDIKNYVDFFNKKASLYGLKFNIDDSITALDSYRGEMEKFYGYSLKRDSAFLKNIESKLKKEKKSIAVIVTGGFHAGNLSKLFADKGYSYIEVMPKISADDSDNPYFRLLAGEKTPFDEFLLKAVSITPQISNLSAPAIFSQMGISAAGPIDLKKMADVEATILKFILGVGEGKCTIGTKWGHIIVSLEPLPSYLKHFQELDFYGLKLYAYRFERTPFAHKAYDIKTSLFDDLPKEPVQPAALKDKPRSSASGEPADLPSGTVKEVSGRASGQAKGDAHGIMAKLAETIANKPYGRIMLAAFTMIPVVVTGCGGSPSQPAQQPQEAPQPPATPIENFAKATGCSPNWDGKKDMAYGYAFGMGDSGQRISQGGRGKMEAFFARLNQAKAQATRVFIRCDNRTSWNGVEDDMRALLDIARTYHVRVIPVIYDYLLYDNKPGLFTDTNARNAEFNNVSALVRNIEDYLRGKNDLGRIIAWDLTNEPDQRSSGAMTDFVAELAKIVKQSTAIPVTLGISVRDISTLKTFISRLGNNLDMIQVHWYPDYGVLPSVDELRSQVPEIGSRSVILGEFGYSQDILGKSFTDVVKDIYKKGYQGVIFWQGNWQGTITIFDYTEYLNWLNANVSVIIPSLSETPPWQKSRASASGELPSPRSDMDSFMKGIISDDAVLRARLITPENWDEVVSILHIKQESPATWSRTIDAIGVMGVFMREQPNVYATPKNKAILTNNPYLSVRNQANLALKTVTEKPEDIQKEIEALRERREELRTQLNRDKRILNAKKSSYRYGGDAFALINRIKSCDKELSMISLALSEANYRFDIARRERKAALSQLSVGDRIKVGNERGLVLDIKEGAVKYMKILPLFATKDKSTEINLNDVDDIIPPEHNPKYPFNPGDKVEIKCDDGKWHRGTIVQAAWSNYEIIAYEKLHDNLKFYLGHGFTISFSHDAKTAEANGLRKLKPSIRASASGEPAIGQQILDAYDSYISTKKTDPSAIDRICDKLGIKDKVEKGTLLAALDSIAKYPGSIDNFATNPAKVLNDEVRSSFERGIEYSRDMAEFPGKLGAGAVAREYESHLSNLDVVISKIRSTQTKARASASGSVEPSKMLTEMTADTVLNRAIRMAESGARSFDESGIRNKEICGQHCSNIATLLKLLLSELKGQSDSKIPETYEGMDKLLPDVLAKERLSEGYDDRRIFITYLLDFLNVARHNKKIIRLRELAPRLEDLVNEEEKGGRGGIMARAGYLLVPNTEYAGGVYVLDGSEIDNKLEAIDEERRGAAAIILSDRYAQKLNTSIDMDYGDFEVNVTIKKADNLLQRYRLVKLMGRQFALQNLTYNISHGSFSLMKYVYSPEDLVKLTKEQLDSHEGERREWVKTQAVDTLVASMEKRLPSKIKRLIAERVFDIADEYNNVSDDKLTEFVKTYSAEAKKRFFSFWGRSAATRLMFGTWIALTAVTLLVEISEGARLIREFGVTIFTGGIVGVIALCYYIPEILQARPKLTAEIEGKEFEEKVRDYIVSSGGARRAAEEAAKNASEGTHRLSASGNSNVEKWLKEKLIGAVDLAKVENPVIANPESYRQIIPVLAYEAANNPNAELRAALQNLILKTGSGMGVELSSIRKLYLRKESLEGALNRRFTIPSMNLRCASFDEARILFETAKRQNVGTFQIEIAPTEVAYTGQNLKEFAASIVAGAVAAGHTGPVFLKLDHMRMDTKRYKEDAEQEVMRVFGVIREAIDAGFYAIDIDASVLEKNPKEVTNPVEQQRDNFTVSARLVEMTRAYAREKGVDLAIGVEVGEVGEAYITEDHIRAFLSNLKEIFKNSSKKLGWDIEMPEVLAIPSGTPHGGLRNPNTGEALTDVTIAFDLLEKASGICKEYGMIGPVQHGASKLPIGLFHMFPDRGVAEVHLATAMSDIEIDSILPDEVRERLLEEFTTSAAAQKVQKGRVDQGKEPLSPEALRKNTERRKLIEKYKSEFWNLPPERRAVREKLLGALFSDWFRLLGVEGTRELAQDLYPKAMETSKFRASASGAEEKMAEKLIKQAVGTAVKSKELASRGKIDSQVIAAARVVLLDKEVQGLISSVAVINRGIGVEITCANPENKEDNLGIKITKMKGDSGTYEVSYFFGPVYYFGGDYSDKHLQFEKPIASNKADLEKLALETLKTLKALPQWKRWLDLKAVPEKIKAETQQNRTSASGELPSPEKDIINFADSIESGDVLQQARLITPENWRQLVSLLREGAELESFDRTAALQHALSAMGIFMQKQPNIYRTAPNIALLKEYAASKNEHISIAAALKPLAEEPETIQEEIAILIVRQKELGELLRVDRTANVVRGVRGFRDAAGDQVISHTELIDAVKTALEAAKARLEAAIGAAQGETGSAGDVRASASGLPVVSKKAAKEVVDTISIIMDRKALKKHGINPNPARAIAATISHDGYRVNPYFKFIHDTESPGDITKPPIDIINMFRFFGLSDILVIKNPDLFTENIRSDLEKIFRYLPAILVNGSIQRFVATTEWNSFIIRFNNIDIRLFLNYKAFKGVYRVMLSKGQKPNSDLYWLVPIMAEMREKDGALEFILPHSSKIPRASASGEMKKISAEDQTTTELLKELLYTAVSKGELHTAQSLTEKLVSLAGKEAIPVIREALKRAAQVGGFIAVRFFTEKLIALAGGKEATPTIRKALKIADGRDTIRELSEKLVLLKDIPGMTEALKITGPSRYLNHTTQLLIATLMSEGGKKEAIQGMTEALKVLAGRECDASYPTDYYFEVNDMTYYLTQKLASLGATQGLIEAFEIAARTKPSITVSIIAESIVSLDNIQAITKALGILESQSIWRGNDIKLLESKLEELTEATRRSSGKSPEDVASRRGRSAGTRASASGKVDISSAGEELAKVIQSIDSMAFSTDLNAPISRELKKALAALKTNDIGTINNVISDIEDYMSVVRNRLDSSSNKNNKLLYSRLQGLRDYIEKAIALLTQISSSYETANETAPDNIKPMNQEEIAKELEKAGSLKEAVPVILNHALIKGLPVHVKAASNRNFTESNIAVTVIEPQGLESADGKRIARTVFELSYAWDTNATLMDSKTLAKERADWYSLKMYSVAVDDTVIERGQGTLDSLRIHNYGEFNDSIQAALRYFETMYTGSIKRDLVSNDTATVTRAWDEILFKKLSPVKYAGIIPDLVNSVDAAREWKNLPSSRGAGIKALGAMGIYAIGAVALLDKITEEERQGNLLIRQYAEETAKSIREAAAQVQSPDDPAHIYMDYIESIKRDLASNDTMMVTRIWNGILSEILLKKLSPVKYAVIIPELVKSVDAAREWKNIPSIRGAGIRALGAMGIYAIGAVALLDKIAEEKKEPGIFIGSEITARQYAGVAAINIRVAAREGIATAEPEESSRASASGELPFPEKDIINFADSIESGDVLLQARLITPENWRQLVSLLREGAELESFDRTAALQHALSTMGIFMQKQPNIYKIAPNIVLLKEYAASKNEHISIAAATALETITEEPQAIQNEIDTLIARQKGLNSQLTKDNHTLGVIASAGGHYEENKSIIEERVAQATKEMNAINIALKEAQSRMAEAKSATYTDETSASEHRASASGIDDADRLEMQRKGEAALAMVKHFNKILTWRAIDLKLGLPKDFEYWQYIARFSREDAEVAAAIFFEIQKKIETKIGKKLAREENGSEAAVDFDVLKEINEKLSDYSYQHRETARTRPSDPVMASVNEEIGLLIPAGVNRDTVLSILTSFRKGRFTETSAREQLSKLAIPPETISLFFKSEKTAASSRAEVIAPEELWKQKGQPVTLVLKDLRKRIMWSQVGDNSTAEIVYIGNGDTTADAVRVENIEKAFSGSLSNRELIDLGIINEPRFPSASSLEKSELPDTRLSASGLTQIPEEDADKFVADLFNIANGRVFKNIRPADIYSILVKEGAYSIEPSNHETAVVITEEIKPSGAIAETLSGVNGGMSAHKNALRNRVNREDLVLLVRNFPELIKQFERAFRNAGKNSISLRLNEELVVGVQRAGSKKRAERIDIYKGFVKGLSSTIVDYDLVKGDKGTLSIKPVTPAQKTAVDYTDLPSGLVREVGRRASASGAKLVTLDEEGVARYASGLTIDNMVEYVNANMEAEGKTVTEGLFHNGVTCYDFVIGAVPVDENGRELPRETLLGPVTGIRSAADKWVTQEKVADITLTHALVSLNSTDEMKDAVTKIYDASKKVEQQRIHCSISKSVLEVMEANLVKERMENNPIKDDDFLKLVGNSKSIRDFLAGITMLDVINDKLEGSKAIMAMPYGMAALYGMARLNLAHVLEKNADDKEAYEAAVRMVAGTVGLLTNNLAKVSDIERELLALAAADPRNFFITKTFEFALPKCSKIDGKDIIAGYERQAEVLRSL